MLTPRRRDRPPPAGGADDRDFNRLAPYNPTHATARAAALAFLALTPRDPSST